MPTIPGTELSVFPLCLGGNVFGWTANRDESFAVLDAYVEAGGNFIDTADTYSSWQGTDGGESETIIGEWMAARGNRDSMIIATKVGKAPKFFNLQPETIRTAAQLSLQRLGTDYIDLYYAHQDHDDPMIDTLHAFDALVQSGSVRYLAASNFTGARLTEALTLAESAHVARYRALQPHYNLLERAEFETELLPVCRENELGVLPYFGLARGYLTGKYRRSEPPVESARAGGVEGYVNDRGEAVLDVVEGIALDRGVTAAAIALAWLAHRETVVAPIASARTVDQLQALLPMVDLALTDDEMSALDTVSAPQT